MLKKIFIFVLFITVLCSGIYITPAYAANASYDYLIKVAKEAYNDENFELAMQYFQIAQAVEPQETEASNYINLIKQASDKRLTVPILVEEKNKTTEIKLRDDRKALIDNALSNITRPATVKAESTKDKRQKEFSDDKKDKKSFFKIPLKKGPGGVTKSGQEKQKKITVVDLDDADKANFPLTVELAPNASFIVKSKSLKRFLSTNEDQVSITRLTNHTAKIEAKFISTVFVHVWNADGRWTFKVQVRYPKVLIPEERSWEDMEGFKFTHSMNWGSFHSGRRNDELHKQSYYLNNSLTVDGPTPYGDFDLSLGWNRSDGSDELNSVRSGIKNGSVGFLQDFTLRIYDIDGSLSSFSLPGSSLKGFFFETPFADGKFDYKVFYGRERDSVYGNLAPGISGSKEVYYEGLKLGYHPSKDHSYYFNVARGYGDDRQEYVTDKAYAIETKHKFEKVRLNTEFGTDDDRFATSINAHLKGDRSSTTYSFKSVETGYTTVSSRAGGAGEIKGTMTYNLSPTEKTSYVSYLALTRDRESYNEEYRGRPNIEWRGSLNHRLSNSSSYGVNMSYGNTSASQFPSRTYMLGTNYAKSFKLEEIGLRNLSFNSGYSFSRSVYPLAPSSESYRNQLFSGLNISLTSRLSFFTNYQYSWVHETESKDSYNPRVARTGLSYSKRFGRDLRASARISYRDEETTEGRFSSMSGQDSIDYSAGLTYAPTESMEFYLDGSVRQYWAEKDGAEKNVTADISFGSRISWDSFIRWAPKTVITGKVFKDINGNKVQDSDEPVMKDIRVIVGPTEDVSDEEGKFKVSVRAKKVIANLDINSVPAGYVFSTASSIEIDTSGGGSREIIFGITPQAGISGVVYFDINGNNMLDRADLPISGVRMILDNKIKTFTNSEGLYFFPEAYSGEHTIAFDIQTIPLKYIPKVKMKKKVDVTEGVTYMHYVPLKKK